MAQLTPELDRLMAMNESDIKRETQRLRGATAMTTYKGRFIPKGGLQKKMEAESEDTKKKIMTLVVGAVGAYLFIQNFL